MNILKKELIELALQYKALQFGDFTLKSGRTSPYFFNAGVFNDGLSLQKIGKIYAKSIIESKIEFDILFGPAYKGIPLASITALSLASYNINKKICFNRKESKDHGEKGNLIGAKLSGNILIIDDVITKGTAFREAQNIILENGGKIAGVAIMLDRCETGTSKKSTIAEIKEQDIPVISLLNVFDIIDYLKIKDSIKANKIESHIQKFK